MRVELRTKPLESGEIVPRGAVFVADSKEESDILDAVFGKSVDGDGLVGQKRIAECRLSDGYGEHYVYVSTKPAPKATGPQPGSPPRIWSDAIVFHLNASQHDHTRHGYTCGNDSSHRPLIATPQGWRCCECDYTQDWAHGVQNVCPECGGWEYREGHTVTFTAPKGFPFKYSGCETCAKRSRDRLEAMGREFAKRQEEAILAAISGETPEATHRNPGE